MNTMALSEAISIERNKILLMPYEKTVKMDILVKLCRRLLRVEKSSGDVMVAHESIGLHALS